MKAQTCPVCRGKGTVPQGFYAEEGVYPISTTAPETCRSCNGQGYVIVPDEQTDMMECDDLEILGDSIDMLSHPYEVPGDGGSCITVHTGEQSEVTWGDIN